MASPACLYHATPHAHIIDWLFTYCAATPGVQIADNATVRLDLDNEPQPDALLRIDSPTLGNSRISNGGYVEGAPELVVEIAASSASLGLGAKLQAYRRNGVREYLVWQVLDGRLDWFALEGSSFVALEPGDDRIFRSRIFPGLWLHSALLESDLATVLAVLHQGLQTQAHREFVERLH